MCKSEKKAAKKAELIDRITEFIADWEMSNHHYCTASDIMVAMPDVKPKKILKALKEIR